MEEISVKTKIGNAIYKVFFVNNEFDKRLYLKEDESYHFGIIDFANEIIYINNTLTLNKLKQILIHEVTHAYVNECGFKGIDYFNEEQLCEFIAMQGEKILISCTEIIENYNIKKLSMIRKKEE